MRAQQLSRPLHLLVSPSVSLPGCGALVGDSLHLFLPQHCNSSPTRSVLPFSQLVGKHPSPSSSRFPVFTLGSSPKKKAVFPISGREELPNPDPLGGSVGLQVEVGIWRE